MKPIRYTIAPAAPEAHVFTVTVTVDSPDPQGQRFSLPAWIPGSYMIREFARNIVRIEASSGDRPVRLTKVDKDTWWAAPCSGPLTVSYDVYAWDLSVRAAHLDATHGFFNGTSVFLRVEGADRLRCLVDIQPPAGDTYKAWRVATALREASGRIQGKAGAKRYGFGWYEAADYDELIVYEDLDYNGSGAEDAGDATWRGMLFPYVKNVGLFVCPSKRLTSAFDGSFDDYGQNGGYAINVAHWVAGAPTPPYGQALASVGDASSVIIFMESDGTHEVGNTDGLNPRGWVPTADWAKRHNDGCNYTFIDGHVKWLKPDAIDSATSDSLMSIEIE